MLRFAQDNFGKGISVKLKILILSTCLLSAFFTGQKTSHADFAPGKKSRICEPLYSDIKTVYFSYNAKLPLYTKDARKTILHDATAKAKEELEAHQIKVLYFPLPEGTELEDKAILLELAYSYAEADAFSIPLNEPTIAAWINRYKINGNKTEYVSRTYINFRNIEFDKQNTLGFLSGSQTKLVETETCRIFEHSLNLRCVNNIKDIISAAKAFSGFEEITEPCTEREKSDMDDYIERSNIKQKITMPGR